MKNVQKRKRLLQSSMTVFIILFTRLPGFAQGIQHKGAVEIPWDEFRKLLELDKDEFILSWEEFQKILQQTGFKYVPPFQLKEEKVVLTRDQFKRLLNQMKPPADPIIQPPADYLLTKAAYKGRISLGSAQFHARYDLEVFNRQRKQYVKIPFFPINIALKNALFDGKRALIVLEGHRHTLTTSETGRHQLEIEFALKAATEQGPWEVSFPVPITAVTSLEIDIPFKNIDVEIKNAQELEIFI